MCIQQNKFSNHPSTPSFPPLSTAEETDHGRPSSLHELPS
jgi:hypothetical protein